jgi:hypothetical protein
VALEQKINPDFIEFAAEGRMLNNDNYLDEGEIKNNCLGKEECIIKICVTLKCSLMWENCEFFVDFAQKDKSFKGIQIEKIKIYNFPSDHIKIQQIIKEKMKVSNGYFKNTLLIKLEDFILSEQENSLKLRM